MTEKKDWREYNSMLKEWDDIYHQAAQRCGLSNAAYWLLYTLCDEEQELSQNDFCKQWFLSKQTVNSAIAALKKEGYIILDTVSHSRRKIIRLTKEGESFCQEKVKPFLDADRASLSGLSPEERSLMLSLMQKQLSLFKKGVQNLWK